MEWIKVAQFPVKAFGINGDKLLGSTQLLVTKCYNKSTSDMP